MVLGGNWHFFCCGGKFLLRPEKKDTVVCLAGARSLLRPEKKATVICLAGARSITTGKKKIQSSVCWVRVSGDYEKKKKDTLRPEKKDTVVCLMGARFWRLRPEKKEDTVVCLLGTWFWRLRPEKKDTVPASSCEAGHRNTSTCPTYRQNSSTCLSKKIFGYNKSDTYLNIRRVMLLYCFL